MKQYDEDDYYDQAYLEDDHINIASSIRENRNIESSEVVLSIQNPYYSQDDDLVASNGNDQTNFETIKVTENPFYE